MVGNPQALGAVPPGSIQHEHDLLARCRTSTPAWQSCWTCRRRQPPRVSAAVVGRVTLRVVGGTGASADRDDQGALESLATLAPPQGVTDLAQALLDVAREDPSVTLLITDGYENLRPGDAALVAAGLRRLGRAGAIYEVMPLYVESERLEQRRLGAPIQTIAVTHESEVRELLARILLHTHGPALSAADTALAQDLVMVR
jgi:hypothetical protein